jgi:hypothetical protein
MNELRYSENTLFHGECYLFQTDTEDYFWQYIEVVSQCVKYYQDWIRIIFQEQRWYSVECDLHMTMNEKQVMIWKKVVVIYLKLLCWHLPGENEKNHESLQSGKPVVSQTRYVRIASVEYYSYRHSLTAKQWDLMT